MSDTSRREFLRRLSLTAAALAADKLRAQTDAEKKTERKLGVALLGLGRYSTNELGPALRKTKKCYLAGVVTGHPEKGDKWAVDYSLNRKNIYNYDNLKRIADNRDIDIVYVVTPPALHPDFAIRVAKAGKHVISENTSCTVPAWQRTVRHRSQSQRTRSQRPSQTSSTKWKKPSAGLWTFPAERSVTR